MSTKTTLADGGGGKWWLESEMLDDSTRLVISTPVCVLQSTSTGTRLELTLPPDLLDRIATIHGNKAFPHQRNNDTT
jgi:hypothetical protein